MTPEEESQERKQVVDDLYNHVLRMANRILHNCKNYNISILAKENPSYSEIAEHMRKVCSLMQVVSDDINGDHKASKAREYAYQIGQIAEAIESEDEESLKKLTEELNRRPFL